eukprot:COSAG02_NODE_45274_length_358_cov_1.598456_1_plen_25_part_01
MTVTKEARETQIWHRVSIGFDLLER